MRCSPLGAKAADVASLGVEPKGADPTGSGKWPASLAGSRDSEITRLVLRMDRKGRFH
jgi:hypothetical protein